MDLIFELEVTICDRFPALDPLAIDEYRAVEVFKLIKSLSTYVDNHETDENTSNQVNKKEGKKYKVKVMDSEEVD